MLQYPVCIENLKMKRKKAKQIPSFNLMPGFQNSEQFVWIWVHIQGVSTRYDILWSPRWPTKIDLLNSEFLQVSYDFRYFLFFTHRNSSNSINHEKSCSQLFLVICFVSILFFKRWGNLRRFFQFGHILKQMCKITSLQFSNFLNLPPLDDCNPFFSYFTSGYILHYINWKVYAKVNFFLDPKLANVRPSKSEKLRVVIWYICMKMGQN